jgi:serine/threonine protein kinase
MLASLEHPNLPRVIETFEEIGKHFLVMEFVAGRTLQNELDITPGFLAEERVRVWARQLLDVMQYLHSQNPPVIYRDLKPANVMLLEGTERIKLIDFGIARFHKAGKNQDTEAFGTAGYAPPEQYGKGQTDARSDVYALAATLHYLLTKHDPSLNPFNWLPVRRYNQAISGQMEAALQTALNLDPQRRFAYIRDFASALGLDIGPAHAAQQPAPAPIFMPAPVAVQAAPAPKPTPAPRSQKLKSSPPKTGTAAQPRQKSPSRLPVAQPSAGAPPIIFTSPVAAPVASAAPMAPVAQSVVAEPPARAAEPAPVQPQRQPVVGNDHGTTSTAPPVSAGNGKDHHGTPALVVSKQALDLGEAWRSKQLMARVDLLNVGDGELEGTVLSRDTWLVPNIHKFRGQIQTVELRVRKAALPLGRVELQVPNLFAIIWARARWALPFVGFWLWVLLLVASSAGQLLLLGLAAVVGALVIIEAVMWLWALQVRLLVPTEKLNTGRLVVQSSGGEQQVQVTVKARPSWLLVAAGWTMAATAMTVELGLVVWAALSLL